MDNTTHFAEGPRFNAAKNKLIELQRKDLVIHLENIAEHNNSLPENQRKDMGKVGYEVVEEVKKDFNYLLK